ncbi:MAG TPA: TMEM175 family protein [bacterium]|nr:TMEM175 family protein [bacterium]
MGKGRLEAFSDGVLAIIITIMVLDLKAPAGTDLAALKTLIPTFTSYVLSFIFVGIYWNNHHHLIHTVKTVSGSILWANLHLLFWLSLVPFFTRWMGDNGFAPLPVALYGVILIFAAIAYTILVRAIIAHHGKDSTLAHAIGKDRKGNVSIALYAAGIPLSLVNPALGYSLYVLVALIWLVPDRRIEKVINE